MSKFEYLTVLISIVDAFAISELLAGWGQMLRRREGVRWSVLHAVVSGALLLYLVQCWWGTWDYREVESWTFGAMLLLLSVYLCLAMAAYLLVPDLRREMVDLEAHFLSVRVPFCVLVGIAIVVTGVAEVVLLAGPVLGVENGLRAPILALLVVAAVSDRPRVHLIAAAIVSLMLVVYIAIVSPVLR